MPSIQPNPCLTWIDYQAEATRLADYARTFSDPLPGDPRLEPPLTVGEHDRLMKQAHRFLRIAEQIREEEA